MFFDCLWYKPMLMRHGRIKNPQKEENLKERSPGLKETTLFQQDVIRRNCGNIQKRNTKAVNVTPVFSLSLALSRCVWETQQKYCHKRIPIRDHPDTLIASQEHKSAKKASSQKVYEGPEKPLGLRLHAVQESLQLQQVQPCDGG